MAIFSLYSFDSSHNLEHIHFLIGNSKYLIFLHKNLVYFAVIFFNFFNTFIRAQFQTIKAPGLISSNQQILDRDDRSE